MGRLALPQGAAVEYDDEPVKPTEIIPPGGRQALPQGAQVTFDDDPIATPGEDVSKLESFGRGAAQGASFGFADEVVGLGHALFGSKDYAGQRYKQNRDEYRAADKRAQEANPLTYGAGGLAGGIATSFVPGLGIAKGAGLAKTALSAGKMGFVSGLGASEAEDVPGQLLDAGGSALISAGTAGLLKGVMDRAPKRAVERALGDITDGATATMRDRVVGKAGDRVKDVLPILREKAFKGAGRDPNKLLTATENALAETGQALDQAYARGGASVPSIPVVQVQRTLDQFAAGLEKDPGKAPLARSVRGLMDDVWKSWSDRKAVTAQDVRVLASDVADTAFRGSPSVAPKAGQATSQQVWGALKGLIDESLEKTAAGSSAEVRALNKRMSTLFNVREAVRYRATREATESTRLKDRISGGLDLGLALAEPSAFVAKKAYDFVGKPLVRMADDRLASLVTAARGGSTRAQIVERGIQLGFSPIVARSLATWATGAAQDLTGEAAAAP